MTLRPLAPQDTPCAVALWNRSAPHDPLTPALFHEKVWGDPDVDPRRALLAVGDRGAPVGLAVGVRWGPPNETRGTVKLIGVAPEHRRLGIGGHLLGAVEQALQEDGAVTCRVAECSPNYLVPGVDLRDTPGWLFVQKHGYAQVGEAVNMTVNLAADPLQPAGARPWSTASDEARLAAAGVTVRRATPADRPGVEALVAAHWPAWIPEVEAAASRTLVSLHVAVRDGAVLGFSAFDANNVGTGWFGPMGTAPEARGLGVGGVLCRRCLADLAGQGLAQATIPWVAPVGFYAHHAGAHVSRVFHRFEKRL